MDRRSTLRLNQGAITFVAVAALAGIAGLFTPIIGQSSKPSQDVNVVNIPTVNASQTGEWNVNARLAPGTSVGIAGTPTVAISGTPTVNVASLPALSVLTEPGFPTTPFFGVATLTAAQGRRFVGDLLGTVGLTSITLSNFDAAPQAVEISNPVLDAAGTCQGTVTGGTLPQFQILVGARQTVHLNYPTPLVFRRVNEASCVGLSMASTLTGGSVQVSVNGFVQ